MLKTAGMLDINKEITPAATMPLVTDADGTPFDKPRKYDSVVGILMYLSRKYRPDIQFAVHQCSRCTHNPSSSHAESFKRICRYLVGKKRKGLTFGPNSYMKMEFYVDADFLGLWKNQYDQDTVFVKSRAGYVMNILVLPLYWVSNIQTDIALSTLEAEYIALYLSEYV